MLGLLLFATFIFAGGATNPLKCGECNVESCPHDCQLRVQDPCGCCEDGICGKNEGDVCKPEEPCGGELFCEMTRDWGVCVCKGDDRPVCGHDGITYKSVCDLNTKTNAGVKSMGACDMPPSIVTAPSTKALQIGKPLTLSCEMKGQPVPSVEWQFSGPQSQKKVLPGDDSMIAVQLRGGPEKLMITSWLQIVSMRESDEGVYKCIAKNIHGATQAQAVVISPSRGKEEEDWRKSY